MVKVDIKLFEKRKAGKGVCFVMRNTQLNVFDYVLWHLKTDNKYLLKIAQANVAVDVSAVDLPVWNDVLLKAKRGRRLFFIQDEQEGINPVVVQKDGDKNSKYVTDSDRLRMYENQFIDLHDLTTSKWDRIAQIAIPVFFAMLAIAAVAVVAVMINSGSTEQIGEWSKNLAPYLNQTMNQTANPSIFDRATQVLGG